MDHRPSTRSCIGEKSCFCQAVFGGKIPQKSPTCRKLDPNHHFGIRVSTQNKGFSPQIIHLFIGFSIINHPFWGPPIFGNTHNGNPFIPGGEFFLWKYPAKDKNLRSRKLGFSCFCPNKFTPSEIEPMDFQKMMGLGTCISGFNYGVTLSIPPVN